MVLNCQNDVALSLPALRSFVRRLRASLNLDGRDFNVCFTSDREIARLNAAYRGKPRPTDVLSFPFEEKGKSVKRAHVRKHAPAFGGRDTGPGLPVGKAERGRAFAPQGPDAVFSGFLGDIVISAGASTVPVIFAFGTGVPSAFRTTPAKATDRGFSTWKSRVNVGSSCTVFYTCWDTTTRRTAAR